MGQRPEHEDRRSTGVTSAVGASDRGADRSTASESDARYRRIAEHVAACVYETDRNGRIVWVSPEIEALIGVPPHEVVGTYMVDRVVPEDLPLMHDTRERVLRGGRGDWVEFRLTRADGAERWVAAAARPLFGTDGTLSGTVVTCWDVDDDHRARADLEAAERRYRALTEGAADVVAEARDGVITWISDSVTDLLGWRPDEMVGQSVAGLLHPDDLSMLADVMRRPMPEAAELVGRVRRADGSYRWLSSRIRDLVGGPDGPTRIACWRDVEDAMSALARLAESEARLRATVDSMLVPHLALAAVRNDDRRVVDFTITDANDAAYEFADLAPPRLIGRSLAGLLRGTSSSDLLERFAAVVESGDPLILEDFVHDDPRRGGRRRIDARAVRLDGGISVTWRDVTEVHDQQERLERQATRDSLTGLANRSGLVDDLDRALSVADRSGRPVAVLMVDLDHFKYVNDTLGHAVGDELLVHAARRLEDCVRRGDLIARLGGDEFVVVMREVPDADVPMRLSSRIVEAFRFPITDGGADLYTTASVGVAISNPTSTSPDMLREADTAMYRAKDEGRDRVSLFNEDLRIAVTERLDLESRLRTALEHDELVVWYQPEIDLVTRRVTAFEALLRWHHPSGVLYTADRFIEAAEETGLISDIGAWVFDRACALVASWSEPPWDGITVRVNLSAHQLSDPGLVETILRSVGRHGIDPERICLEITETALMRDTVVARRNVEVLHDFGFRVAIDDFGTGYASLAYLRDHPIDVVKIDRGFVASMARDPRSAALVAGIVALAHQIGVDIVAEGVEDEEHVRALVDLGCTRAQGFLFSPAVAEEEATAMVLDLDR